MARFFFDLHECGNISKDDEGVERVGLEEIRDAAYRSAREVMCAELVEGRLCLACHIEVRDETGAVVLTVPFREAVTITGLAR